MKNTRPSSQQLTSAVGTAHRMVSGDDISRNDLAAACRFVLAELAFQHPGGTLEIRVPPFAAVQVGLGDRGDHTRGTPPNVVQMSPETLLRLFAKDLTWLDANNTHLVQASGIYTDISTWFS